MGQLVAVVEKPSAVPGIIRFEANRSLTGQGHETFRAAADAVGPRPAAVVARRLLETGQVESVHVYSNVLTVNLNKGFLGEGLDEIVRDLYQFWKPGMEPQVEMPAEEPAAAAPAGGDAPAAGGQSAYELRVPAVLRERAVSGRAKWLANHGG